MNEDTETTSTLRVARAGEDWKVAALGAVFEALSPHMDGRQLADVVPLLMSLICTTLAQQFPPGLREEMAASLARKLDDVAAMGIPDLPSD